jgi:hypothetical protein
MSNLKIKVGICKLNTDWIVSEVGYNIPDYLAKDLGPIDYPAADTDSLTSELFCTPMRVREFIEKNREEVARDIAAEMVRLFAKDDTVMGYKREWK